MTQLLPPCSVRCSGKSTTRALRLLVMDDYVCTDHIFDDPSPQECLLFNLSNDLLSVLVPLIICRVQPVHRVSMRGRKGPKPVLLPDDIFDLLITCKLMRKLLEPFLNFRDPRIIAKQLQPGYYHYSKNRKCVGSPSIYSLPPGHGWSLPRHRVIQSLFKFCQNANGLERCIDSISLMPKSEDIGSFGRRGSRRISPFICSSILEHGKRLELFSVLPIHKKQIPRGL